jgi:hypothetical protein
MDCRRTGPRWYCLTVPLCHCEGIGILSPRNNHPWCPQVAPYRVAMRLYASQLDTLPPGRAQLLIRDPLPAGRAPRIIALPPWIGKQPSIGFSQGGQAVALLSCDLQTGMV